MHSAFNLHCIYQCKLNFLYFSKYRHTIVIVTHLKLFWRILEVTHEYLIEFCQVRLTEELSERGCNPEVSRSH